MIWICSLFTLLSIFLSILQSVYSDTTVFAILNNISVCILTGCLIALIQFVVGYRSAKYDALLNFYRSSLVLEDEFVHYPYTHAGFVDAKTGLTDIRKIIGLFDYDVKVAFWQIDMPAEKTEELKAACNLYVFYQEQIQVLKSFREKLCEAVRFQGMTDEQLYRSGITDIRKENIRINAALQDKETELENAYNDSDALKIVHNEYGALEKYLFGRAFEQQ